MGGAEQADVDSGMNVLDGWARARLQFLLRLSGQPTLEPELAERFEAYLQLLLRWNSKTNLTAIRDAEEILRRHFVESIICARGLPKGIGTLLDLGSGAGFPGLPIAMIRNEVSVTLAESQGKKAAFLREASRVIGVDVRVHSRRAEELTEPFDCVTMRAVDRMGRAVRVGASLVRAGGWLAPMITAAESAAMRETVGAEFRWVEPVGLSEAGRGILELGRRLSRG